MSIDTDFVLVYYESVRGDYMEKKFIETKEDVQSYLAKLQYALKDDRVLIRFQRTRRVDEGKNLMYTNTYTFDKLFPNESEDEVFKRELSKLEIENYIESVIDKRFKDRTPFRVFVKPYDDAKVYIKIRVQIIENQVFVMSFHFAEYNVTNESFPFKECE